MKQRMIFLSVIFCVWCLMGSITQAQVKSIQVDRPIGSHFVAYASNRVVVKFDESILQKLNKVAFAFGRAGISELDGRLQRTTHLGSRNTKTDGSDIKSLFQALADLQLGTRMMSE